MKKPLPYILLASLAIGLSAPAFADKPAWAGNGKQNGNDYGDYNDHGGHGKGKKGGGKPDRYDERRGGDVNISVGAYFGSPQRQAVYDYYGPDVRAGHCPPGLAKKNNGCMPPGQAKKWALGQPLAVAYYPVPATLVARLGPPPAGHKYVRVASDILLITVGTSMVVDAIQDLGGL